MSSEIEFLKRELAFVGLIRKTRRQSELHLVEPAVKRERQILAELEQIKADPPGAAPSSEPQTIEAGAHS